MSLAQGRLSRVQIEQVLRRAAELEARQTGGEQPDEGEETRLSEQDVLRLGEEAGLSQSSLQNALQELQRGQLVAGERDSLDRALGARQIVVTRSVPGPAGPVRRAIERFLREQLMTVRRHHGDRVEWERARGLWPGLARSLDFARRYAFGPVTRVETEVISEGEQSTLVRFRIDLSELRRHRLLRACLRAGAAFSIFGLGGSLFFPGFGLPDVASLLAGGAAAGGLMALERRRYEENRAFVTLAPERFLDLLVLRRRRALVAVSGGGEE
jgi:hypothetical protein